MAANSRGNLIKTINHKQPAGIVFDLGGTNVSNISASTLYKLRIALGLKPKPVKLCDPYQGLGLVEEDVREIIGVDVAGITSLYTAFGYKNENWKPWKLPDGTDVLVGQDFTVRKDENGNTLIFPGSDTCCSPSAKMPKNGFYFDPINRQQALERIKIFSPGGGFVFGAIHNIQPNVPVENILALIDAVKEARRK